MRSLIISLLVLASLGLHAQDIRVKIKAQPSGVAKYSVDGEEKGLADGKKARFGFNERKGIVEHKVEIFATGYESQSFVYGLGSKRNEEIVCTLQRKLPKITDNTSLVVDVEKVVSGIEYGTDLGANTRWKYRYDEEINLSTKAREFDKAIRAMGLSTLNQASDDLFDVGKSKPKNADILIAGRVEHFGLVRGGSLNYKSDIRVNWQLYDRYNKEIILKEDVASEYQFASSIISEEFHKAIIDNFYYFLSQNSDFEDAINSIDADAIVKDTADDEESNYDVERVSIQRVRIEPSEDFGDIIELAMNASVTVIIDQDKGHGSGVVVSSDGYIVTNHHVVDGAKLIDVQFANGITLAADVISSSEKHDLGLIKVRASGLTALPILEESDKAREGDEVVVIGAPGDRELGQSVSKGIISAKRTIDGVKIIQTDTKISPGNSGSPLINKEGEIIGIINMKMVGKGIEGLSFAIDAKYLYSVLGLDYE
ncbi:MAG: hypothetical protein Salg2KO_12910 [Salibacteraceae bacterium]